MTTSRTEVLTEPEKPRTEMVRAIDIVPYQYAIWCTVAGSQPFENEIVSRKWSEDGKRIWFMLESFNFYDADPTECVEVVPFRYEWTTDAERARQQKEHDAFKARWLAGAHFVSRGGR